MENKKLLAEALLEIAKKSSTEIIEIGGDYELIEIAEKLGIKLPSPDLAVIKTVYAEIDKVNRNGIVLPREAVKKGLPTLIGKQINWEHNGAGKICGYIIDAKINNDLIEITGVIFKSLFPEEMEQVKEKFEKKDLCVSFEIWNRNPEDKESVVHELENGFRSIDPIIFHGCGLLLVNPPACPKAKVYKLVAKVLTETEKIIEKVFGEDLIFASLAIEESKCKNCGTCTCEKEEPKVAELYELLIAETPLEINEDEITSFENEYEDGEIEEAKKLTYEEKKNLSDDDFAVVVTVKNKVTGEPRKIRMFVIKDEAHVRNALARLPQASETLKKLGISQEEVLKKILKRAKELNMTELLKRYEKADETSAEEAKEKLCPECKQPMKDEEKDEELCAVCKKKKYEMHKSSEETQAEINPEETKTEEKSEVAETKSEEIQAKETKEEIIVENKIEESTIITTTQETTKVDEMKQEEEVITTEVKTEQIVVDDEGKQKQKIEEEIKTIVTYTFEQVQEQVKAVEEELVAAMPKEVSYKIKELIKEGKSVKEAMKQAWDEYKKSQEKALEEKDTEIKIKIEELGKKDQEIADLKNPKVEEKKEKVLTVGSVESKDNYKKIQDEVNEKGFGKR
jgi:hypothetical protein